MWLIFISPPHSNNIYKHNLPQSIMAVLGSLWMFYTWLQHRKRQIWKYFILPYHSKIHEFSLYLIILSNIRIKISHEMLIPPSFLVTRILLHFLTQYYYARNISYEHLNTIFTQNDKYIIFNILSICISFCNIIKYYKLIKILKEVSYFN